MPQFRIQGKTFFLTYPQCDRAKEDLHAYIKSLDPTAVLAIITCKEEHEDGSPHLHCVVQYTTRKDIRDERYYDYEGFHPNIQTCRSPKASVTYVMKGGDFINEGFDFARKVDVWTEFKKAVAESSNADEVMTKTMDACGTAGLKLYFQLRAAADKYCKGSRKHTPLMSYPEAFVLPDAVEGYVEAFAGWIDYEVPPVTRSGRYSLWFYGDSRLGKTVLARSIGTHWYMGFAWCVDNFDDDAEYGVLDDMSWDQLKFNYKGMLGCQRDIVVTDKYRHKRTIRHGRPVIVCTNDLPEFTDEERRWLDANIKFVHITQKLFREE